MPSFRDVADTYPVDERGAFFHPKVKIGKVKNVKKIVKDLKDVQPETFKQLRKDMRSDVKPLVQAIKGDIPMNSPFFGKKRDGFAHDGRTAWDKTNPQSVSVNTPLATGGKSAQTVVMLTTNSAAVAIADKAGMRGDSSGRKPKQKFNINLNKVTGKKAQRYAWRTTVRNIKLVYEIQTKIVGRIEKATNQKIKMSN
jgi:hypothetical protein